LNVVKYLFRQMPAMCDRSLSFPTKGAWAGVSNALVGDEPTFPPRLETRRSGVERGLSEIKIRVNSCHSWQKKSWQKKKNFFLCAYQKNMYLWPTFFEGCL